MATVGTALPSASGRSGLRGTLISEYTKIRSVRSTYWTLLALLAVSIGLGAAISAATAGHWNQMSPHDQSTFDATQTSLAGMFYLGQLVIVVLGALVLTSEYSTGMIRTSLTAMPRRSVVYAAKALVFAGATLAVTLVTSFITFFLGQALLTSTHDQATISGAGVLRAVIGSAIYVTLCGLFAFALGSLLRHTAGAITAGLGILFVLPIIAHVLPNSWYYEVERWLPSSAGTAISTTVGPVDSHLFSGWGEMIVFAAYVAIVLLAGVTLFRKRDA
jgi:ABC-type transport system involved in multi-copper enzyme maturation permease subunit